MPNDVINTVTIHGTTYDIGGSGGGHTIKNPAGTAMTQRSNLQFVDLTVSDDSTNDATKVESVHVIQSESELENLPDGLYMLNDDEDTVIDSDLVGYDNTDSGLEATNVKDAIDEVVGTLDDKIDISTKGVANGVAELDENGKVPSSQLPSYVDDVIEVADYDHLPTTGETGKIYVTLDTNKTYRWGGTEYVEISESLALGETSSTAYRGDRGKTAYDHSQITSGNPHNVTKSEVGLGNVDNTSDSTKKTNFTGSLAAGDSGFVQGGTIYVALNKKADTVTNAANGNLAGLNGYGNLTDSGWVGAKDTTSISGNPISISGLKSNQLAVNPIITFEPIQDLHGQSKPYPAGGGKNKLACTVENIKAANAAGTWSGNAWTYNGVTVTILTDSTNNVIGFNVNGTTNANTSFLIDQKTVLPINNYIVASSWESSQTWEGIYWRETRALNIYVGADPVNTVSDGTKALYFYLYMASGHTYSNLKVKPMIRLATETDATFAPYENICPISGYDKVESLSCGKNLFDKTRVELGQINQTTGEDENSSTVYRYKGYIYLKPNTKYTIGKNNGQTLRVFFYSQNDYLNSSTYTGTVTTFNTGDTIRRIRFQSADFNTIKEILQVEEATTPTAYSPYNKATSISESLGQTVYGGTLDVRSGKFTVTHAKKRMDGNDTFNGSSIGTNAQLTLSDMKVGRWASDEMVVCDSLPKTSQTSELGFNPGANNNTVYFYNLNAIDASINSSPTLNAYLANHPIEFTYPLATPIEIQLTPHEISLLKDYAYVSTNGTNIVLDYHNGELASLADVSQLGETVNELGEYVKDVYGIKYGTFYVSVTANTRKTITTSEDIVEGTLPTEFGRCVFSLRAANETFPSSGVVMYNKTGNTDTIAVLINATNSRLSINWIQFP